MSAMFEINLPNIPEDGMMTVKQARQIVEHLHELREELRYMFAHIDKENLSQELKDEIENGGADEELRRRVADAEGNVSKLFQTAKYISLTVAGVDGKLAELILDTTGLVAAIDNNRLVFTAEGLTIKNALGVTVFKQENDTGNLMITGRIVADSGRIGGFNIEAGALSNGSAIRLDAANGLVQLGGLTITDSANFGPVLEAGSGLAVRVGNALYMLCGNNMIQMNMALKAQYGLYVNPSKTTTLAANAYIDPMTGEIMRSTASGGGTGGSLTASVTLSAASVAPGTQVTVTGTAAGGTAPYTYAFAVSQGGGAYQTLAGTGGARSYTPGTAGTYRFRLIVTDGASGSYEAYSGELSVGSSGGVLQGNVTANASNVMVGAQVTWTAYVSGGSGSYQIGIRLMRDGVNVGVWTQQSLTYTLSNGGTYWAELLVEDLVSHETLNVPGGYVSCGVQQYGYTTGTKVNVRSGPGTGYGVVAEIPTSGTQVTITGTQTGGWWPVYWNGYNGYISGDYLTV